MLSGFPGQVKRIDRDAVPAQARAWIKRHIAKRLGLGGLDNLPHIDAHLVVDNLELVHQGHVHGTEDVSVSFTASAVLASETTTVLMTKAS